MTDEKNKELRAFWEEAHKTWKQRVQDIITKERENFIDEKILEFGDLFEIAPGLEELREQLEWLSRKP